MSPSFAVIDFETTGLVPEKHDRVVEVGVVLIDSVGSVEWEWSSLINPKRDIGASHIHGISAREVLDAPEFGDVADPLLDALRGRVVVAHNASFDMRFLHRELLRAGYQIHGRPEALCSMKWAGRMVGAAKLSHCCEALGIELTDAHSGLGDARATAQLVTRLEENGRKVDEWRQDADRSLAFAWPGSRVSGQTPRTVGRAPHEPVPTSWMGTILADTWIPGSPENEASYLLTLDAALLDRSISVTEGHQLVETARIGNLSAERVMELHQNHLEFLAVEAWSDGILTTEEEADLQHVATSLGLPGEALAAAISKAKAGIRYGEHVDDPATFLHAGDRVVFTGEMSRPRDAWVDDIVAVGLASGGINKSTRVLVTSDQDSMSGKAAKARSYGIPVIDEPTFERMFAAYAAQHETESIRSPMDLQ